MRRFQLYIDGAFEDGAARFESLDPATGSAWALMPRGREAESTAPSRRRIAPSPIRPGAD